MRWDVLVLGLVIYSCFTVPYDATFRPNWAGDNWVYLTDGIFYLDIVLNFWTGYDKGYEVIMSKKRIVVHYLRTWFFVDVVATVDWSIFIVVFFGGSNDPADTPIFVKMLALIKILRLARAGRLIDSLAKDWTLDSGLVDAFKFFLYVAVVAHLLGCFFFLWPVIATSGSPECLEDTSMSQAVRECIEGIGDCDTKTDGIGWFYKGQCRQNGWRQQYMLEEICLPKLCSPHTSGEHFDVNYDVRLYEDLTEKCNPESAFDRPVEMADDETTEYLLRCLDTAENTLNTTDANYQLCPLCMRPFRRYIDALYWSLTTMTTIGYGDRGPKTENELFYALFAEVFGLAFFALLLTHIDRVNIILGRSKQVIKDDKDGILQFLMNRRLPKALVEETVRFMNFRATSLSGNAYDDDDGGIFHELSDGLKLRIKQGVYMPKLKSIPFFGWDDQDDEEEAMIKGLFDETDTDNGGSLDKAEVNALFTKLKLELSEPQFETCFDELDRRNTGVVSFDEFSWWWFLTKNGVPRISSGVKCPIDFLAQMCDCLKPRPFAKGERLVEMRQYGNDFVILLVGLLRIKRPEMRPGTPGSGPDDENRGDKRDKMIKPYDREPIFGFSACLTKPQWHHVKNRTDWWVIEADEYSDTLWISRKEFYRCFSDYWPGGRPDMVELAYFHYQIGLIFNGKTELDAQHHESPSARPGIAGDGISGSKSTRGLVPTTVEEALANRGERKKMQKHESAWSMDKDKSGHVSKEEFEAASAAVPYGFQQHFKDDPNAVGRPQMALWDQVWEKDEADHRNTSNQHIEKTHHEATEEDFLAKQEVTFAKVTEMERQFEFLNADLEAVQRSVDAILKHHRVRGAESEDGESWYERKEAEKASNEDAVKQKKIAEIRAAAEAQIAGLEKNYEESRGRFSGGGRPVADLDEV